MSVKDAMARIPRAADGSVRVKELEDELINMGMERGEAKDLIARSLRGLCDRWITRVSPMVERFLTIDEHIHGRELSAVEHVRLYEEMNPIERRVLDAHLDGTIYYYDINKWHFDVWAADERAEGRPEAEITWANCVEETCLLRLTSNAEGEHVLLPAEDPAILWAELERDAEEERERHERANGER